MAIYPLAQISSSRVAPWRWDECFAAKEGVTVGLYRYQGKLFYFPEISEARPSSPWPPCCGGKESVWQSVFFSGDVLSFSRADDEVMCFLSGEIKRHIPQPDRRRKLEWFPEKLLNVVCMISNFYFGCRSISLLHLIMHRGNTNSIISMGVWANMHTRTTGKAGTTLRPKCETR